VPGIIERLAILVDLDGSKAIAEMQKVGRAAERDLGKAQDGTKKLSTGMMVAGGGMVAAGALVSKALSGMSDDFIQTGKDTLALQRATGDTAEEASRLRFAAQQTGTSVDTLATGLKFLSKNMAAGKDAFREIGVATKDAGGGLRNTHDVLFDVADAFKGMEDGAKKTDLALKLFGRSGTDMIPMLNRGGQALRELEAQAKSYGLELTGENLAAVKANIKAHRELDAAMQGVRVQIGTGVTGALNTMLTPLVNSAKWFAQLDPNAKAAAGSVGMFGGTALVAGGSGLVLVGTLLKVKTTLDAAKEAGPVMSRLAGGIGAASIAAAGAAAAWGIWQAKMSELDSQAGDIADKFGAKVQAGTFAEANASLAKLSSTVKENKAEVDAWNASWDPRKVLDADYINGLSNLNNKLDEQGRHTADMINKAHDLNQATGMGIEAAWKQVTAEDRLNQVRRDNPKLTEDEAKAIAGLGNSAEDTRKKLDDMWNQLTGQFDAGQRVQDTADRVSTALGKIGELQRSGKTNTAEYSAAVRDLSGSIEAHSRAQAESYVAQIIANGGTVDAWQKTAIYRDQLQQLADKYPAVRAQLQPTIDMARQTVVTQFLTQFGWTGDPFIKSLLEAMMSHKFDNDAVLKHAAQTALQQAGIDTSKIPQFATGGIVPGNRGAPTLAIVHGGEEVVPVGGRPMAAQPSGSGGTIQVPIYLDGHEITRVVVDRQRSEAYAGVG
jgi:hypothetical protein